MASTSGRTTLLSIANTVLANRRLFVRLPVAVAAIVSVVSLLLPRTYTSSLSLVPQVPDNNLASGAGLAAQLGINLPGFDLTQTPDFYVALLRTQSIMRDLVDTRYMVVDSDGDTTHEDLIAHYDVTAAPTTKARDMAVEILTKKTRASSDLKTGVVSFEVRDNDPNVALGIAQRALALVNRFNTKTRNSRAANERAFLAGRITQVVAELRLKEDSMQAFLDANRDYPTSPKLMFEHDRIARNMALDQDLFASLGQQIERARVDEVRNTPVITVVERPILAPRPDRRYLIYKGLFSLALGAALAALIVFGRLQLERQRNDEPDQAHRFDGLLGATYDDARRLVRRGASRNRR